MSHTYAVKTVKTQMTEMQSKERLNIQKKPHKIRILPQPEYLCSKIYWLIYF